jgi:acyl carrier protein
MLSDILDQINIVVRDVLDNDAIVLKEGTVANEVRGWDSLTHVEIIVAIEKRFKIRFATKEIQSFKNVGDMCNAVAAKRPQ